MSHSAWLFCSLIISMVIILVLILKVKLNAAISLVLGSILMGLLSGISMVDTIEGINTGFGNMLKGMGLPIGFGIILGELVSASGGAKIIAHKIVKAFPKTKAIYAIGLAAFILAIPVYFDVTFVILIPIGVALMKEINKSIAHIVGAITIGAAAAHTMVPPTPAPLAAGEIFGFDTGIMIGFGTVFGLIGVFLVIFIYTKFLDKKTTFWNPALDESAEGVQIDAKEDAAVNPPSFGLSLLPIFVPIILILLNTVTGSAMGDAQPSIFVFLGDKTTALLAGAIVAYLIGVKCMGKEKAEKTATDSLSSAGIVFLITGAGGAFSNIITITGVSDAISDIVSGFTSNVFVVIILAYFVGLLIKQVTGSGTVSALTSMTIMSSVASSVALPPVMIAMACLAGTLFGATVNDSGFWIVTNMSGVSVKGGIKTYTLSEMIESVTFLILLLLVTLGYVIIF
ncbi:GntP family permease [Lactonifactor longoviformis]|uniref:GntP family permease n=1 Tax=Lactonifactor longoviformis TaxID=341220 RepID=UPI001D0078A6|nr:GntP family permease [Lactonifactor longoviformis]MCB5712931.1 GntP family permease [Lactonifactor longoviformis]MCB5716991.1 GntP family permease [Lactonifactor longoviformis]